MDESKVTMKGRLGPGMMITVDLQSGQVHNLFSQEYFALIIFGSILILLLISID